MKPRKSNQAATQAGADFSGAIAGFSGAQKLACVSGLLKPEFGEYVNHRFTQMEVDEIVSETQCGNLSDVEIQTALIRELSPWIVATILGRGGFSQII